MLDSDNLPLRDPEYLFRTPEYLRSGSLFFSDWWDIVEWVKPEAYTAFGLDFPGYKQVSLAAESGQVLLNRCAALQTPSCHSAYMQSAMQQHCAADGLSACKPL